MTLTQLVKALPGVQIIGSSAILNGKYVAHSRMDSIDITDYGHELLDGPPELEADDLPVLDVPAKGKGKGGKKAQVVDEPIDPLDLGE